jgi:acyl-CoA thioester hydrolase
MRFHEAIHDVYFDDLDAFQILHNARYLLLFERTIGSFWSQFGFSGLPSAGANPDQFQLVRYNELEYLQPVEGLGQVRVRVWVERMGRTSLTFRLRMSPLDEDSDYATGRRVVVKVNPKTRQPEAWSDAFKEKIAPYVSEN